MPPQAECGFPGNPDQLLKFGPRVDVQIGLDVQALAAKLHSSLPSKLWPALVDTGATECCIDSSLASALQLPIVDRRTVSGALGGGEVNVHIGQLRVPSLDHTMYGLFAGVHLVSGGQPYAALIGRTLLRQYTMTYRGDTGSVILSGGP